MSDQKYTPTIYFVECEDCYDSGPESRDGRQAARDEAKFAGWKLNTAQGDLCPICAMALSNKAQKP